MKKLIALGSSAVIFSVLAAVATPLLGRDASLSLDGSSAASAAVLDDGLVASLADLRIDMDLTGPCPDSCVICPEPNDDEHACWEEAGSGGDGCPHDEGCTAFGDCDDHACEPTMQEDYDLLLAQVNTAMKLVERASGQEVGRFLAANPKAVTFNTERRALQFFRCQDGRQVLAHVPLREAVARDLGEAASDR